MQRSLSSDFPPLAALSLSDPNSPLSSTDSSSLLWDQRHYPTNQPLPFSSSSDCMYSSQYASPQQQPSFQQLFRRTMNPAPESTQRFYQFGAYGGASSYYPSAWSLHSQNAGKATSSNSIPSLALHIPDLTFPPSPAASSTDSASSLSTPSPGPRSDPVRVVADVPLLAPRPLPYHSPTFLQFDLLPDVDDDLSHPPYTHRPAKRKRVEEPEFDPFAFGFDGPRAAKRPVQHHVSERQLHPIYPPMDYASMYPAAVGGGAHRMQHASKQRRRWR